MAAWEFAKFAPKTDVTLTIRERGTLLALLG